MKQCPRCGKTYSDDELNFCLEDGELLSTNVQTSRYSDDPPTVMLSDARRTNPSNWPETAPVAPLAQWQGQPTNLQGQFGGYALPQSPSQTLAIISIGLGAATITIGWCCSSGMLLGPAAIITGIIAMIFAKNDPQQYGGRGLAIGGIAMGAAYFVFIILFFIIYGAIIGLGAIAN